MFDLPPEFDPAWYRAHAAEAADLEDEAAERHYREQGRPRGIPGSPAALRENLLALIGEDQSVLEIGPYHSPMKRGPRVHYLDMLDADALRRRAAKTGHDPAGVPETIHHVGGLEDVGDTYDILLGSHSIEHQPDLVSHLRAAEKVLDPGGAYVLMVPDKRYCFDHFIAESSIAGVLQAWEERRTRHSLASLIEHRALTTHNDPARHWAGDHGNPRRDRINRLRMALDEYAGAGDRYLDVHAWYFIPGSFRSILAELHELGLIGLAPTRVYGPVRDRNEFCAVLSRP